MLTALPPPRCPPATVPFHRPACRIVLEQLQGPAGPTLNGATSYNEQAYLDLMDFLGAPMKGEGGDEWLEAVMRKNHALGERIAVPYECRSWKHSLS